MSVLVVDDQPLNRLLLGKLLRSLNLHVLEAQDGEQACQTYLRYGRSVAFIFLDLMMPVLDGFGAALSIRSAESREGWSAVPIIAYTSEDVRQGSPLWQQCMRSGFNDAVPKPMSKRHATQLLSRWMPGAQLPPAAALCGNGGGGGGASSSSGASSCDEELLCRCSQVPPSCCGKCRQDSHSSAAARFMPSSSTGRECGSSTPSSGSDASAQHGAVSGGCGADSGSSACSPRSVPPPTHN